MDSASSSSRLTSFTRNGLTFDVTDAGPLDGDIVVLLHGFPQKATSWAGVSAQLAGHGYRTVAVDQRGYSPGARPRGRRAYRLSELTGDVVALIDRLDVGPVHLIGHDWGANVGWSVAAHHPERVRTWTAVSVPHPAAFSRALRSADQARRSWYMGFFQIPLVPELAIGRTRWGGSVLLARSGMEAAARERFRREIVQGGALPGALGWYRALPFVSPTPRVRVPTTFVWSSGDSAVSRRAAELCAGYVTGPYRFVELAGTHWIPDQQPTAVVDAFLDGVTRSR
ncbi:alpha/beta hydrolase [Tersicoccus phoenicis]|uniref:Alpha/beta hydrolase n=1 Tax=Tersicoccus phoenicis TaxID=554083 RepID=A0A1R1L8Y3_9MICC|nr:alpha/beta fold hydrolase [Tersicoccus phoenicis]OMH23973.1 alpha/beta hydrolase [Tersicoccus phoenicis]